MLIVPGQIGDPGDQELIEEPEPLHGDHLQEEAAAAATEVDPVRPLGVADGATDLKGPNGGVAAVVATTAPRM